MKKIILLVVVLLIVVTGSFLFYSDNKDHRSGSEDTISETIIQENSQINTDKQNTNTVASVNALGYVDYTEENLLKSSSSSRVLFFHAPWCSVCNFYEGQIEDQGVPEDITILKIDYDSEDELKEKYGITVQSTFVLLDSEGNIEKSWPFAQGLSNIQDLYDQVL